MSEKLCVPKDKYYQFVYDIIHKYDFASVARYSDDEYSGEVRDIIKKLPNCNTIEDIQKMLYDLFVEWFHKNLICDDQNLYKQAAEELYNIEIAV